MANMQGIHIPDEFRKIIEEKLDTLWQHAYTLIGNSAAAPVDSVFVWNETEGRMETVSIDAVIPEKTESPEEAYDRAMRGI